MFKTERSKYHNKTMRCFFALIHFIALWWIIIQLIWVLLFSPKEFVKRHFKLSGNWNFDKSFVSTQYFNRRKDGPSSLNDELREKRLDRGGGSQGSGSFWPNVICPNAVWSNAIWPKGHLVECRFAEIENNCELQLTFTCNEFQSSSIGTICF